MGGCQSNSCMLLNSDKPIWDSRVLSFPGLKPTGKSNSDRQELVIEICGKIVDWYKKYLSTAEAEENIRIFDEMLIGKFCSIGCDAKFIFNSANHTLSLRDNNPKY